MSPILTRRMAAQLLAGGSLAAMLPRQGSAQGTEALSIAYPGDVPVWDPNLRTHVVGHSLFKTVFDQPLTYTPDLKLSPALVTQWQSAPDGKTLDLQFRDDVSFHNGDRLTAEDFRYTFFERPHAEKLDISGIWRRVSDIEVVSPTHAVMHFSSPMPSAIPWLAFLASFVVPKKYMTSVGHDGFIAKPIGSGPYKLASYEQNARIGLEAFDGYWGEKPAYKQVTFEILGDVSSRTAAIESRRVGLSAEVPVREATRLGTDPQLRSSIEPFTDIYILQVANTGAFTDKRVRLAAHHAIDKAAISKALFGGKAVPISVPAARGTPGYPADFTFAYDPAMAASLMKEAGFSTDKPADITLSTTNGTFPGDFDMTRVIAQMWGKIGLRAKVETIEFVQYQERLRAGKSSEATTYRWGNMTGDPELYTGYLLNPKFPFAAWHSDDISERLDPLFSETDEAKRNAGYRAFNQWAVENGYTIPLLQGVASSVYRRTVGFVPYANGWIIPQVYKPA
jgi:peptide/nickel transport system substrate-binding protein